MRIQSEKAVQTSCEGRHESDGNAERGAARLKRALRSIVFAPFAAAFRLHQYRNLHSAMVYEVLCQHDHCEQS